MWARILGQMAEPPSADGLRRSERGAGSRRAARLRPETMPHPPKIPPEAELRRARSLIADLPAIAWEADATSMAFTFVSEGVRDLLGYDASEWLADPGFWNEHLHPQDRDRMVARLVRIGSAGGTFDEEYRLQARDGSWGWVRRQGQAAFDTRGTPRSIRGLMVDVTKRVRAERETEAMEGRFQRVIEHLPAIVYLEAVTREENGIGEMLYVSPQVQEILGFSPDEWLADPIAWARQFHPEDRLRIREEYDRIERTGG